MLANTYGIAMPAKMDIESQILSKQRRLPAPSSRLGLEILTGDVDRFGRLLPGSPRRPTGRAKDRHARGDGGEVGAQ